MKISPSRKLFFVIFSLVCVLGVSLSFLHLGHGSRKDEPSKVDGLAASDDGVNYENQFCNLTKADKWLEEQGLNSYGDEAGTMYMGGTPLFNESTGKSTYRYDYLKKKFENLPWMDLTCDNDYPDCVTDYPLRVGDGKCDPELNSSECGLDGGDCE
mmetsp:Transcript_19030/g.23979  ORF Transcript_19030/g.23979 Transcript_19030/m.23979 type:complete len:156 (+) Transcript_19030:166-633(+)